jgi:hypothetical protein
MGRYNKNKNGFYPGFIANGNSIEVIEDVLTAIRFLLKLKIRDQRLRCFVNDIFEYLERMEGFHYGLTEKAQRLSKKGEISTDNVTLDHAVPSIILNRTLKQEKFNTNEELLEFLRKHYFMCLITKEEDKKLNKYKQTMPDDWNNDWENWDARYKKVDIVLKVLPGNKS